MKKFVFMFVCFIFLGTIGAVPLELVFAANETNAKIAFWDTQRKGANFFNSVETLERFQAARKLGIEVVRLAPNKWLNGRPKNELGDFLIGSKSTNTIPIQKDVDYLKAILDKAHKADINVVLTMLSLPGNRWSQHNHGRQERGLWKSFSVQNRVIQFWTALAKQLKDHPALVGYNIKNEPTPERVKPAFKDWFTDDYEKWSEKVEGTPADLNLFYNKTIRSIRSEDPHTPIILDSGFYGTPWAFKILKPIPQPYIIYSFHMYEPYAFTNHRNKGKFDYPGMIPTGETESTSLLWNRAQISKFFVPIREWQEKYDIPNNRIFVGEIGVFRENKGAGQYLEDVIHVVEENNWHWAFYAFREDTWPGMDYELGTGKPGWKYWQAIEKGESPDYSKSKPNPVFNTIQKALNR